MWRLTLFRERCLSLAGCVLAFLHGRRAVSTVEYALITIAVVSIVGASIVLLGGSFENLFGELQSELNDARAAAKTAGVT